MLQCVVSKLLAPFGFGAFVNVADADMSRDISGESRTCNRPGEKLVYCIVTIERQMRKAMTPMPNPTIPRTMLDIQNVRSFPGPGRGRHAAAGFAIPS